MKLGKLDEAIVELTRAIQINPRLCRSTLLARRCLFLSRVKGFYHARLLIERWLWEGSYIIDTMIRIVDEAHTIVEPPGSAVIESEESIKRAFPPEFFEDPAKIGIPRRWKSPPQ